MRLTLYFSMENLSLNDKSEVKTYTGIPEAYFVNDVNAFMAKPENSAGADKVLKQLDEQHNKYKFMEFNLVTKKRRLRLQIPDLNRSLEMVNLLKQQKEEMDTHFLLSEQVFVKAKVPPTETVCLWLGANVMLEYPLDEAEQLLQKSVETADKNLEQLEHDLDFLRDQITTTEVNMARVYNWDVKRRQNNKST